MKHLYSPESSALTLSQVKTENVVVGEAIEGGRNRTANVEEDTKVLQVALQKYRRICDVQF